MNQTEQTVSAKPTYEDLQSRVDELEKEVTHCRRLQEAVWRERRQVLELFNSFPMYVFGETQDHTIQYANDFFGERFGNPVGQRCSDFFRKVGGDRARCPAPEILMEMRPRTWEWQDAPDDGVYLVYSYPFAAGQSGMPLVLEFGIEMTSQSVIDREHLLLTEELQQAFAEMKALQRVVPICSCCRQPRNDDLQRQQIADYIHNHADQHFTFDLCPSCLQKYCVPTGAA
jgi:hypothetical protein